MSGRDSVLLSQIEKPSTVLGGDSFPLCHVERAFRVSSRQPSAVSGTETSAVSGRQPSAVSGTEPIAVSGRELFAVLGRESLRLSDRESSALSGSESIQLCQVESFFSVRLREPSGVPGRKRVQL